jgi:hypothetical protein
LDTSSIARLIAFYLPQFHPIPENDEWWGKGFTEWTNVAKAKPLFRGHVQPQLPGELSFYDLRVPETRQAQADLARDHGIEAFCYYHYWFAGRRLLERPFDEVLTSKKPDFPFCLAWANQSWTGVWHGCPDRILMEQTYPGREDYERHFRSLLPAFQDERYLRIEGAPLFLVYQPNDLPDCREFAACWREMAEKSGLGGLHLVGMPNGDWVPSDHGFDGFVPNVIRESVIALTGGRPWTLLDRICNKTCKRRWRELRARLRTCPDVYRYSDIVRASARLPLRPDTYPAVVPNWDNTPRSGARGLVLQGSSPELFGEWMRDAIAAVTDRPADRRLVFIKSWNEWAEGNFLEPSQLSGRDCLEEIRSALQESNLQGRCESKGASHA